ncbi:MAG: bifunctional oligoribonuclease/PAP phosphatase NrnA [Candidatus Pacebacteria bacterium]|nr:bifunctional oligoribonuclease/PAP phosphatase NrnA [Candidatus Paceibacterota bacterium]MBP9818648.1 bifunctional oligoribonuclease/PAP phosphatase NrnA [Candidatus Paceibacterota bacterium]
MNNPNTTQSNPVRTNILTPDQKQIAKQIFDHLQADGTKSILMHCHPSPDPDSLGSTLATKFALETLGKKVTIIAGDSKIPEAFMHFPGAPEILPRNYFETDLTQFDTFIILDSGSPSMISRKGDVVFPPVSNPNLKTIVIDHHATNEGYGDINLVVNQYISTTEILFDLYQEWNISFSKEIATNLYVGLFTDGGGFRYDRITDHSFYMAGVMYSYNSNLLKVIEVLENSASKNSVDFMGLALTQKKIFNSIDTNPESKKGSFVISYVSYNDIQRLGLTLEDYWNGNIVSHMIKAVVGWNVTAMMIEVNPGEVKCSFRTRDQVEFDVSKVALALGGGGHKSAAGATIKKPLPEAIEEVARVVRETLFC